MAAAAADVDDASQGDAAGVSARRGRRGIREAVAETRAVPDRKPCRGLERETEARRLSLHPKPSRGLFESCAPSTILATLART